MSSRFDLLVHPARLRILHAFGVGDTELTRDELPAGDAAPDQGGAEPRG